MISVNNVRHHHDRYLGGETLDQGLIVRRASKCDGAPPASLALPLECFPALQPGIISLGGVALELEVTLQDEVFDVMVIQNHWNGNPMWEVDKRIGLLTDHGIKAVASDQ
jgi:hypothetical protein